MEVAGTRRSAHTSVHSHPRARATPASRQAGRGSRASCPTSRGPGRARTLPQDRKSRTQLCPSVGGLSPPCPASSSTDSDPGPALCPPGSWQPLSAAFPALSVTVLSHLLPSISLKALLPSFPHLLIPSNPASTSWLLPKCMILPWVIPIGVIFRGLLPTNPNHSSGFVL